MNQQQISVCFAGTSDTFTVTFICNDSYPGELKFVREEINSASNIHDTFFEFHTALACAPAPVDCQVTGKYLEFGWAQSNKSWRGRGSNLFEAGPTL